MARTTSTQRGASRRSAPTASKGASGRGAATARTRAKGGATARKRTAPARSSVRRPAGPWVPVLVIGLVVVLGWSLYPAMRLQYQESRRMAGLQQQYDSLKSRNQALRTQVAELKTPAGVEKAAREDLGYAKSGDHVYIVMPSGGSSSSAAPSSTASVAGDPGSSVVQSILDAIFGVSQPSQNLAP
jgi:cell division protein FtsB